MSRFLRVSPLAGLLCLTACSARDSAPEAQAEAQAPATNRVEARPTPERPEPASSQLLGPAINGFGIALWSQLRSRPGNLVIAPASIHAALTMTWMGAKAETRTQLSAALRLDPSLDANTVGGELGGQLRAWETSEGLTLHTANRLFGERSEPFKADYLAMLESTLAAPLEPLDFKGAAEPSRAHINQWVAGQTEDRVRELIPSGGITESTRLVLTNAIDFIADWASPFAPSATTDAPFYGIEGETRVRMMHATQYYPYLEDETVQVLRLAYAAEGFAMTVVLPREGKTLDSVEASLDTEQLARWLSSPASAYVELSAPKFELAPAASLKLVPVLRELGVRDAFEASTADFTGIANPAEPSAARLFISEVFHRAFVVVDEKGTEAAAATAVATGYGRGSPPESVSVNLDHPFLFFIHDGPGTVLFMGRLVAPA